jgi:hypothetical protein
MKQLPNLNVANQLKELRILRKWFNFSMALIFEMLGLKAEDLLASPLAPEQMCFARCI